MKFFFLLITFSFLLLTPLTPSYAQTSIWQGTRCAPNPSQGPDTPCDLCDALVVASNITKILLKAALAITAGVIAIGAFFLMTAAGSEDRVKKGKDAIKNAILGVIIALAAWLIVNTVFHILTGNPKFPWYSLTC